MSPRGARRKEPAEVTQAVEPAKPAKTANAVEPVEPTKAVEAVEQAQTVESVEPVEVGPPKPPTARFEISRSRKGDAKAHFDNFDVEVVPGATVLDALLAIKRRHDPSLVVRHSCLHASCGTCGVRVNGREALACDTKVASLPAGKPIKVEPLANQRVVADLATDMVDFYARFEPAGLPLIRAAEARSAVPPDGVKSFGRFENCIECGLCLSACPIARANRAYIGPAALAAAARVVAEPRGHDLGPVLALAAEPDSVWRCRDAMECTAVCPAAVDPARAVVSLRRHVAFTGLKRFIRRER